jgi:hypothetical protein
VRRRASNRGICCNHLYKGLRKFAQLPFFNPVNCTILYQSVPLVGSALLANPSCNLEKKNSAHYSTGGKRNIWVSGC